jgi:excisionase family DNA binding protein
MMDQGKILLVRLSLGAIGEENAYLLGSLLVAKIYMAALSRQETKEEERKPFYLYLDEAHHFLTPSMNQILSGVRKYRIGLTLAHQQLAQFHYADADILASVLSNCYTRICFRVDDADAERLAKGFSFFTSDHLKNLGVGQAIARFEQANFSFNIRTLPAEEVRPELGSERNRAVIERSRKLYAKSRTEVEDELRNDRPKLYETRSKRAESVSAEASFVEDSKRIDGGRGGRHHDELQQVVRRMAEKLGFKVEIEKQVLDGAGRVDVSLEKDDLRVACEVSVTNTPDYEVHNAEKCLAAGYDHVFVIVSNRKKLPLIERKLNAEIPTNLEHRVKACSLMDLLAFLQQSSGLDITVPKAKPRRGGRLNFTEACKLLSKAPSTVYRWIKEGRIPFYRVGREYQFDRDEILLIGRHDLSGKRKVVVDVEPLKVGKVIPKGRKEQDARYRKLLKLD